MSFLAKAAPIEPFEPKTYREAVKSSWAPQWIPSMEDEFVSLQENGTWKVVRRPVDRHVLRGKWVYKLKRGAQGEILRWKFRYVVRGFEQKHGINFNETFASVVCPMSYKALLAMAAAYDCVRFEISLHMVYSSRPATEQASEMRWSMHPHGAP